ncbi:hypothetical protein T552_03533 [Pneumocystis carinii B80]|uniref:Uncharacterized protein n=1 Tax=Pneumocystis carinii (strain B80) TaxID=1408658 RepID=A0A0W4ZB35_PNEC8|nr:hypothetical protein T552_03533 [Pneumocystis carinii B80]KTW25672.1 hypothetical protein T552_03533 [Pneumocystis carinii B80]
MRVNGAKSSSPDPLDILSSSRALYMTPNCRPSLSLVHEKLELSTDIRRIGVYVDIGNDREEVLFVSPKKRNKHRVIGTCTKKSNEIKEEEDSGESFSEIVSGNKRALDEKKRGKKKLVKEEKKTSNIECLDGEPVFVQDEGNIMEDQGIKKVEEEDFDEEGACLCNNMIPSEKKRNREKGFYNDEDDMDVDEAKNNLSSSTNEVVKRSNDNTRTSCKKSTSKKRINIKKQEKTPNTTRILESKNVIIEPNRSIESTKSVTPKKDVLIEVSSLSKGSAERAENALILTGKFEFESIEDQEDSTKCEEKFEEKRCWTKNEWKLLDLLLIKHKKIKKALDCFLKVNNNFSEEEVDKRLKVLLFKKKENYYLHINKRNKSNNHIQIRNNRSSNSVFEWKNWLKW